MRCRNCITALNFGRFVLVAAFALSSTYGSGQRLAILAPDESSTAPIIADSLAQLISDQMKVLDRDQVATAFKSVSIDNPFNMTMSEARHAADAIGGDHLLLVRSGRLRRTSFVKPEYYEAWTALYLVDGRSGEMIDWSLKSVQAADQATADRLLSSSLPVIAKEVASKLRDREKSRSRPKMEEISSGDSDPSRDLKPPVPYRRIKPAYTESAFLYDIRATVDLEVDISAAGSVENIRVVRWAGFGLDESAIKAVRDMNWRPAMRDGTPLAMRVLLRYNFTKVEKE